MDCAPTLDVVDGPFEEEEEEEAEEDRPEVWGRLFPLGKGFVAQGEASAPIMLNSSPQKLWFLSRLHSVVIISPVIVSACNTALDFVKDEYTFGRGEECDYCFESQGGRTNPHFPAFSKTHFRIFRVCEP